MNFPETIIRKVGRSTLSAVLVDISNGIYKITEDFSYSIRYKGVTYEIVVPKDFLTNFASVPKTFWKLFHPTDERLLVASCVHDYILNENSHLQIVHERVVFIDGILKQISESINGFLAADLFFFSLSQEGSYNLVVR